MTLANNGTGMDHFLTPTEYLDAGHPLVRTTAATLISVPAGTCPMGRPNWPALPVALAG